MHRVKKRVTMRNLMFTAFAAIACAGLLQDASAKGASGANVKDVAKETAASARRTAAICICDLIDNCLSGMRARYAKGFKDAPGCMTMPTTTEAETFLAADFKKKKPSMSSAEATRLAKADVAAGGARNNSSFATQATGGWVIFLPGVETASYWKKKIYIYDESGDFDHEANDPAAKRGSGGPGMPTNVAMGEALRKTYKDLLGYMKDLALMDANKPAQGQPDKGWTATRVSVMGNILKAYCRLHGGLSRKGHLLVAGQFRTAVLACASKARRLLSSTK